MQRIHKAKERIESTNRLPVLRKEASRAKEQLEKLDAQATAEISRLECEVQSAAIEAAMCAARG